MRIKIALIGLGHWGNNHLKALLKMKRAGAIDEIVLCDSRVEHGTKLAAEYDLEFQPDFKEVLADTSVNALDIVTPIELHYDMCLAALEKGKDVFVEKPLTDSIEKGGHLIEIAEQNKCLLMVGHVFRFHPAIQKLIELLKNGELGNVRSVDIVRQAFRIPRPDRGVLFELAIHDVDLGCYIMGEEKPSHMTAFSQSFYSKYPDEASIILMKFSENRILKIESSWIDPIANKVRTLKLIGSKKSAFIDFLKPNELLVSNGHIITESGELKIVEGETERVTTREGMPLDIELNHFIECIGNRQLPLADGRVGLNALELVLQALASATSTSPEGVKIDG